MVEPQGPPLGSLLTFLPNLGTGWRGKVLEAPAALHSPPWPHSSFRHLHFHPALPLDPSTRSFAVSVFLASLPHFSPLSLSILLPPFLFSVLTASPPSSPSWTCVPSPLPLPALFPRHPPVAGPGTPVCLQQDSELLGFCPRQSAYGQEGTGSLGRHDGSTARPGPPV